MKNEIRKWLLAGTSSCVLGTGTAMSQDVTFAAAGDEGGGSELLEVTVVGSRIAGAKVTEALPVVVLDAEKLANTGAVSGDELIRTIPQMGDVSFNPNNSAQTSNAARGDIGSINLRSLGVGNTLVLLNGRRVVTHAASQGLSDTGTVPVLSYNSNAIPTTGLERFEVLLDGAAALYGSDAVAGVVNTVIKTDYDGLKASVQYGGAEGTNLRETKVNLQAGHNFERGNLSALFEYTKREALRAEDQPFTATADLRPLFAGDPAFAGLTGADSRATRGVWPALQTPGANGTLRAGSTALTSSAGSFYIKPATFNPATACRAALPGGLCIASGALPTTGANRDLRYDTGRGVTVMPEVKRANLFLSGKYELTDNLEAFAEVGYYRAETFRLQPAVINLNSIWIPASNYWNPFGPVTFANGTANPNRLPGLNNVPAAGLPVLMSNYRFVDAGPQTVDVTGEQQRYLFGLRGEALGFKWDSAFVYSTASAEDLAHAVKSSALQAQLALSNPDAYNPFNGGCVNDLGYGDCTPSSAAAIEAISFTMRRFSKTKLTMLDFRASRADLYGLPAGNLGMAFGAEVRRESQLDDRDPTVDGSAPFVDAVSGAINLSDAAAVSPNPDTRGSRTVSAAYVEFAVPVVADSMGIPLVRALDLQLAGRIERYSDFGSVSRPKVALAWDVVDGIRLRGSLSRGFRAPNLEQTNAVAYARLASVQDYIRCEADLRKGRIASFATCGNSASFSRRVSGNPELEPETSRNQSFGVVLEPKFLPDAAGRMTLTVDYWKIEQKGIVGVLGNNTAVAQDYLARLQGGSNPNVVRDAPNADDIAFFAGSGLNPVGRIIAVDDAFRNLQPQTVRGIDFGAYWASPATSLGEFDLSLNATKMLEYSREPGPAVDALFEARASGLINVATPLAESADLIRADGRPVWRASASLTWSLGPVQVGLFGRYIGAVDETGFVDALGNRQVVEAQSTANVYAQYRFGKVTGALEGLRVRLGVRNVTNKMPPLTSEGYLGSLYNPYARYWYTNLSKSF